ncbi:hypothetical protein [Rhodococcus erythropolis]|uniref:hypothetical protein n=1 Tax=Rhodococcus erythropolis TaxID=1833 RepID=UPI0008788B14|nr:hypothetical protein [Rhodococcus erythropolis]OFV76951.1 hypothetical protein RERY_24020 [Rhodococcus erythropolis]
MIGRARREPLLDRVVEKLFIGTAAREPFLIRHEWALPVGIFGGCALFGGGALWLAWTDWGRPVLTWIGIGIAVLTAALLIYMFISLHRATRGPLPALDRTPRTARAVLSVDDSEGHTILLRYRGVDGHRHSAQLADYPDETWIDKFAPGSTWQVYSFRDPDLAESVVFLTEAHDDVWRAGYVLDGVRIGGEGGPLKPAPGSPFLRGDSRWRFAS